MPAFPGRFPGPSHPRGKHFTVDIHCHVLTEAAEAMFRAAGQVERRPRDVFANARTREVNRQQSERTRVQVTSVEKRLADMDLMGIDIQALTPAPNQTYYETSPDLGIATARAINDNIADIVGRHPDRFVGLGTVPFQAPELAVAELERLHRSLGLRGIEIATNVAGEDLSADRFRRIFAKAEELGLTIFMHPTGFTEARRFGDHYFTNVIGNPLDTTVAVHHLIFGGVLEDLPETEAGACAWRRIPAGLFGPHRPRCQRASRLLRADTRGRCGPNRPAGTRRLRKHQLQLRTFLQHAAEDQMMHRHRGVERIADHVGEVMIAETPRLGEPVGCMKIVSPSSSALANIRRNRSADRSSPATLVAISMPRRPSDLCSRSSSATASSGA